MSKFFLFIIILILFISSGLIFLGRPLQKLFLEYERGYPIEILTYFPEGYRVPDEDIYLNSDSGAGGKGGLLEVKSTNDSHFIVFRQMRGEQDLTNNLSNELSSKYQTKMAGYVNSFPATIYLSTSGENLYAWQENNLRYEILTDDPAISSGEVDKMAESKTILKLDLLKPAKDFIKQRIQ